MKGCESVPMSVSTLSPSASTVQSIWFSLVTHCWWVIPPIRVNFLQPPEPPDPPDPPSPSLSSSPTSVYRSSSSVSPPSTPCYQPRTSFLEVNQYQSTVVSIVCRIVTSMCRTVTVVSPTVNIITVLRQDKFLLLGWNFWFHLGPLRFAGLYVRTSCVLVFAKPNPRYKTSLVTRPRSILLNQSYFSTNNGALGPLPTCLPLYLFCCSVYHVQLVIHCNGLMWILDLGGLLMGVLRSSPLKSMTSLQTSSTTGVERLFTNCLLPPDARYNISSSYYKLNTVSLYPSSLARFRTTTLRMIPTLTIGETFQQLPLISTNLHRGNGILQLLSLQAVSLESWIPSTTRLGYSLMLRVQRLTSISPRVVVIPSKKRGTCSNFLTFMSKEKIDTFDLFDVLLNGSTLFSAASFKIMKLVLVGIAVTDDYLVIVCLIMIGVLLRLKLKVIEILGHLYYFVCLFVRTLSILFYALMISMLVALNLEDVFSLLYYS